MSTITSMPSSSQLISTSVFPWHSLDDDILFEIFSSLPQRDRLSLCLVNKRCNRLATKLIYRKVYLNDSNVVRSDFMDLAINWTFLSIPSFLPEDESREIANSKLKMLIDTFKKNILNLESVEWIRINWDLDSFLQKDILTLLCTKGKSLKRLENITDASCNDIIANGEISKRQVTSFDMAPPNSLPELPVPPNYIPNLKQYLNQRISSRLSHMTLFIDPMKLFNYLYPLKGKLQIVDLKFHWRREFYPNEYFINKIQKVPLKNLSEIFDTRTLKILTVISWNESLLPREIEMIKNFKEFINLQDISLISIKQDTNLLVPLFENLKKLKRIKMDFLEDYIPETTNPKIFLTILTNCKNLEFIDIRFEGMDTPIISIKENRFELQQKCFCSKCDYIFNSILKKKIFLFPEDRYLTDIHDLAAKDLFKMMRYLSLLPYSKACDTYPSVRTQPMNLKEFVSKMNHNIFVYRKHRDQLVLNSDYNYDENMTNDTSNNSGMTPNSNHFTQSIINEDSNIIDHPWINDDEGVETEVEVVEDDEDEVSDENRFDDINNRVEVENDNLNMNMRDVTIANNESEIDNHNDGPVMHTHTDLEDEVNLLKLPHEPLTEQDIVDCYHALIHHYRITYIAFLKGFPKLRFLMLNDIPTVCIEEDCERIFEPVLFHKNYTTNLAGWTRYHNDRKREVSGTNDTAAKRATVI